MNLSLNIEPYNTENYPEHGKHILAQTSGDQIIVYQAYRAETADYATKHQKLGGPLYSFNRMSWIKPNFLWMMYRSGWAMKEGQERVLAFWIPKTFFDKVLDEAVLSSFDSDYYRDTEDWKNELNVKRVRLQWDPDHNPYGKPLDRRAIQLGLKDDILKEFATVAVQKIEDVTPFAHSQLEHVNAKRLEQLMVPVERPYVPASSNLQTKLRLDSIV
jgi:hypothetical protein